MSYLDFFGLKREPFSNTPNDLFYFDSIPHAQALRKLIHAAEGMKGLVVLIGDVGAGKSTLARKLLMTLPSANYVVSLLVLMNSDLTPLGLLQQLAEQLDITTPSLDKSLLLSQIQERLKALHQQKMKTVVVIDEAQMLSSRAVMEELRGLLNIEVNAEKVITFVLIGLPEVEKMLMLDPPLQQRVAFRLHLKELSADATEAYIKHRLRISGATRMPFTLEAVRAIHSVAHGTPRVINTLCDNCLYEAFELKSQLVQERLVRRCASDLALVIQATVQPTFVEPPISIPPSTVPSLPAQAPVSTPPKSAPNIQQLSDLQHFLSKG